MLRNRNLKNPPSARVPKNTPEGLSGWAKHIDLMIRIDNRDPPEIERLIRWCQQDRFWAKYFEYKTQGEMGNIGSSITITAHDRRECWMRPITTNGTDGKIPVPDHSRGEAWKYEAQEDVCSFCQSIGECPLGTGGWQFMLDKQASEEKGYPDFRLRRCDRWLAADSQERAEKMLGARFAERTFETFEVKKENAEAFEKCKAYADRLNHDTERAAHCICRHGETHLAAAIIKGI